MHSIIKKIVAGVVACSMLFIMGSVFAAPQSTQQKIDTYNEKLTKIQSNLDEISRSLTLLQEELRQATNNYNNLLNQVKERIKANYETGSDTVLEYIFSSKNPSEFFERVWNTQYITKSDRDLLNKTRKAKENLERKIAEIEKSKKKLEQEKRDIEELRKSATSELEKKRLAETSAAADSAGTFTPGADISNIASSNSPKLQKFISIMIALCNDNSHGYSQSNRWGPNFDCSSSIIYSLRAAGLQTGSANYTGNMDVLCRYGWKKISSSSAGRGDILVCSSHAALYLGNGQTAEFHRDYDGRSGDSSGRESNVGKSWKPSSSYSYALRYTGN